MTYRCSQQDAILWFALLVFMLTGCASNLEAEKSKEEEAKGLSAEGVAQLYCADCHVFPEPQLLDKKSWQSVLPSMRHFMGLRYDGEDPYRGKGLQEGLYLGAADIFPDEPLISDTNWQKIEAYILQLAPDSLPLLPDRDLPQNSVFNERLVSPSLGGFPAICMLDFDTVNHRLYVGDINGFIAELDESFSIKNFSQLTNPIVKSVRLHDINQLLLLDVGVLDPKDLPAGAIVMTDLNSFAQRAVVFEELTRPVDFQLADFDHDGLDDIVVCGFGNLVGSLSWYHNTGTTYQKIPLVHQPGAIKLHCLDVEKDGDEDVIVLFAQGDEGIQLFRNDGLGNFDVDTLLRFHPLFGSTDFQLVDMDHDQDLDLVLSNGDNSDGSQVLKPYHGIRVFLNEGGFKLQESFFFPMHGAYKILVNDFDLDGDQDLIAIAFYPDYGRLDQSIIYFENVGGNDFQPSGFHHSGAGRWMVMDVGDIDRDGDQDVIIGSFALGPGHVPETTLRHWRTSKDHLLWLENKTR